MTKATFLLLLALAAVCCTAQSPKVERIALAQSQYYMAAVPVSKEIKGAVVLLDGFGGSPEGIFPETKIPDVAFENGWLTVALSAGKKMYADSLVVLQLNQVCTDVMTRYHIPKNRFVLGGFSAGGAIAMRYVEYCYQFPDQFPIAPIGLFAIDSPIDLFDIWSYFEREIAKNYHPAGVNEAKNVLAIMNNEIGTPTTHATLFEKLTPFNNRLKSAGNEQYLAHIPVRVYHDMDVNWYLQNRRRSIYDCNYLVTSELINRLLIMGNNKAEFVVGKKGYRSNGLNHPHSWSVVDEQEWMTWVNSLLVH